MAMLCWFANTHRRPIPPNADLTFSPLDESVENKTGIVTKALFDLQKMLACQVCSDSIIDNNAKAEIKSIAGCTSFSARVSLLFKSNAALRHGREFPDPYILSWGEPCSVKSCCDDAAFDVLNCADDVE